MGNHALNHFGTNRESANLFEPGHLLPFDPAYFDDGSLDYLDGAGEVSGFVPIDEVGDDHEDSESDQVWQDFLESLTSIREEIYDDWHDNEAPDEVDDECLCVGYCGCNHRNRDAKVHSKKGRRFMSGRRGKGDYRRLARRRRQSIRRQAELLLILA